MRKLYDKICARCRTSFQTRYKTQKYCCHKCALAVGSSPGGSKDREFTRDTAFLCQLYRNRGESVRRIAEDLNRSVESVKKALSVPLDVGHQELIDNDVYRRKRH